eukprot:Blabericola_migrator_1__4199@NODE_228_length_11100_cov_168_633645_g194_i0_p3_GENE_NODE_228_length_11100_cov_168_633645_g194_i0NODE_228_length_11100_cov_168_633645_g194_i0_p3_ORF_typecomplete_len475_score120_06Rtt106/PF08512_12/0_037Rtt106/PF08512_12/4_8e21POB3_N/PF17292_2/1e18POB3_N/PF17292_2/1_3e04POB3_N/PF17292_2/4_5e02SSrecog/PF03531_14/4_4e18SSrecog/PF03531_14/1_4e03SSrecog/PF03531_14/1_4e04RNA_pol_3_Rpc31/PF11705_8/13_NODE_228_length_11100_cov_168_633645_g194_i052686692
MATVKDITFQSIRGTLGPDQGPFKILNDLFGWKNSVTLAIIQKEAREVESIEWFRATAREHTLSFTLKSGEKLEFTGFKEADFELLSNYIKKHWKQVITTTRPATKGWHWGQYEVSAKRLCFKVDGKRSFEVPFDQLANVTTSKAELALEFEGPPTKDPNVDQIMEIRFVVPQPEEGDAGDLAEAMKTEILDASGLASAATDAIVTFDYKQCSMPPGRFDVQVFQSLLKLHGKSLDFTVHYDNVQTIFLLPSSAGTYSNLLLQLTNPLRKGQTKYPAVIVQLDDKKEIDVQLNATPEEVSDWTAKVPEIKQNMTAIECEVAGYLLRALTKKTLIGPSEFRGSTEYPCFRCSQKTSNGFFYPLQRLFVFIPKPVIIVRFEDIVSVDFGRTQGSQTRLFEFQLSLKSGGEVEFSSVDRQELQPFRDFLAAKGLKTRARAKDRDELDDEEDDAEEAGGDDEDEESDEDFEVDDEEEE